MAVKNGEVSDDVVEQKQSMVNEKEPVFEDLEREVGTTGECETVYHTVPSEIRKLLELSDDDTVSIDAYKDGYWVEPKRGDDE